MIYLFLTMLAAHENYGDDLNFTKKDIDLFFKKYIDINNLKCNERGYILLLRNNYITKEQFCIYFSNTIDLLIEDNKLFLVCNNFSDILPDNYNTETEFLDGEFDWTSDYYGGYDPENFWNDYNQSTLKSIIKFCIKRGIEIDDELMTEENTKIKNNEIYFKDKKLKEIIFDTDYEDDFEELSDELIRAINDAQDTANYNDCYSKIKRNFINDIGDFEYRINESGKEKLYIKLNISLSEIEKQLKEWDGEYEFEDENYGSIYHILSEMEYFKFQKPDYDYISGSIDDEDLNQYTQERLSW